MKSPLVAYWTRILGAWLLLRFASSVMKDAERLLSKTASGKTIAPGDA